MHVTSCCRLTTIRYHVHAACGGVSVLGFTAVDTGHSKVVDDAVSQGIHRNTVGRNAAFLSSGASGAAGFSRASIGLQLLIGQLCYACHIVGNNAHAHAYGAGLGSIPIPHQVDNISFISGANIHSAAGGHLVLVLNMLYFFARCKVDIIIYQGFCMGCATHIGYHARNTQFTSFRATKDNAQIQNIVARINSNGASINFDSIHDLHLAIGIGILHAHSAAETILTTGGAGKIRNRRHFASQKHIGFYSISINSNISSITGNNLGISTQIYICCMGKLLNTYSTAHHGRGVLILLGVSAGRHMHIYIIGHI